MAEQKPRNTVEYQKLLLIGASPKRRRIPVSDDFDIESDRRVYCKHYSTCLDYAVSEKWVSWTCKDCTINEPITIDDKRAVVFEIVKVTLAK